MEIKPNAYWHLPLAAATLAALFWGAWWLVAGSVPSVSLDGVEVSRWLDVPAAAIFALAVVWGCRIAARLDEKNPVCGLIVCLNIGLVFGLVVGLLYGLLVGLVSGLLLALGYGLPYGLLCILFYGPPAILSRSALWRRIGTWLLGG